MAMAEITKKNTINLLPKKNDAFLTQFLGWSLTIGRLLVIVTETLALSVFLYRFSIDMQIIDLHDKIKNASIIVSNFKEGEDAYRDLHARLSFAKEYDNKKDKKLIVLQDIIEMGAGKVTFKSIIVNSEGVQIEARAQSARLLSVFTNQLKNYQEITNVSVERVENKTSSSLVTIGISADIK